MNDLQTIPLLKMPKMGNVRCLPTGKLTPVLKQQGPAFPNNPRCMKPCILFDPAQPNMDLSTWTVWSKSSTVDTIGRVADNEFRALVSSPFHHLLTVCLCVRYRSATDHQTSPANDTKVCAPTRV